MKPSENFIIMIQSSSLTRVLTACMMALALGSCQTGSVSVRESKPLNVIYIMADDHAYQAISAYGSDLATLAPTPNIDRIARMGHAWTKCTAQTASVARVVLPS